MRKAVALQIVALLVSGMLSVAEGRLYRWVDDDGNVHYSDNVPPDQVDSGHTEISEEGVRIRSVPRAKTPEEIEKEKELERLRTQQERLLEQQRSADRVLLRSFRSEDDIRMARDGKLAAIDVMIDVTKKNVRRQQEWLAGLRAEAANLERTGKVVHQHLIDNIAQTERAIQEAYSTIVDREHQKTTIRSSFDQDIVRFRQLKNLPGSETKREAEEARPVLHNIVTCTGEEECNRLWTKAKAYVRQKAMTTIQTSGDNIVITAPPASEQDVGLILSRIIDKEGDGASLFLDLQCERSLRGERTCQGEQAQAIIEEFRPAIAGENAPPP
jgi:hypothetical protein